MNYRARSFEKAFKRRLRPALRSSPELWKQYKLARRRARSWDAGTIWQGLMASFIVMRAMINPDSDEPALRIITALSLYAMGTALNRCGALLVRMGRSNELLMSFLLPIPKEDVFHFALRRLWLGSVPFLFVAMLLLARAGALLLPWHGVVFGLLAGFGLWIATIALVPALASLLFRLPVLGAWTGLGLVLAACLSFLFPLSLVFEVYQGVRWLPPNWLIQGLLSTADLGSDYWTAWLMTVAFVGIGWHSLRRLRSDFYTKYEAVEIVPLTVEEHPDMDAPPEDGVALDSDQLRVREEFKAQQAAQDVLVQGLPGGEDAAQGWIENLGAGLFSPRERIVCAFLMGDATSFWSERWRIAAWISIAIVTSVALLHLPIAIWGYGAAIASAFALPLFGGHWPGWEMRQSAAQVSPMSVAYPIGYWESLRVACKANLVRVATAIPVSLITVIGACWFSGQPVRTGFLIVLRWALVICAAQPFMLHGKFLFHSNFHKSTNRHVMGYYLFGFLPGLVLVVAGLIYLVPAEDPLWMAVGFGLLLVASLWMAWVGGRLHDRGRIDMVVPSGEQFLSSGS
ncbi:MAG: hypothetical protein HYX26_03685 [Acidobacteriales bacterium]|nr:hypothetical protein [Terriglobales bacterium]